MSVLGVGPLEFLLILFIAFLVLGPEDMTEQARKLGKFIRKLRHSEAWYLFTNIRYEIEDLPRRLLEEDDQTALWDERGFEHDIVEPCAGQAARTHGEKEDDLSAERNREGGN